MKKLIITILNFIIELLTEKKENLGVEQIKIHEGLRLKMYKCPAGKWTIGYGFNLEANKITKKIADLMLETQVNYFVAECQRRWPWMLDMVEPRQWVFYNMAFNMGVKELSKFKKTLFAAKSRLWVECTNHIKNSAYYKQVGLRSRELCKQMLTGEWVMR